MFLYKRSGLMLLGMSLIFSLGIDAQGLKPLRSFMQIGSTLAGAIPYGNNPKAGHYLNTGNARIYYEVYGKGKPFVVLHGGVFGSTLEMGRFIDSLSKSYQVVAISTRGHGRSEMGTTEPTYEQKASDVKAILSNLTKDSAIVLGFSDGGYTGYYLASHFPDKVKKLITIGAGDWLKGSRSFNITRKDAFALDSIYWEQQLALSPDPERFDAWLVSINKYYNTVDISKEVFEKVHCPVLLMAGELDQNAPLKTVLAAYHMLPKVQLAIIPNAPHPAFQVNFAAVWADMVPFLQE